MYGAYGFEDKEERELKMRIQLQKLEWSKQERGVY